MPVCGNYLFFELPKKIVLNPKDGIFRQDSDICGTELRHQFLAGIVGDQGDPHCCSLPGSM